MHEQYMKRCLELAALGRSYVSPNPLVGAVVVHNDKIIGEGYHQRYGQAHAEVVAIASVADKSLLKDSTIYVSLEPCAHFGKTPPCANLIVEHQIPRVVMAMEDPFLQVSGKGRQILLNAGIQVISGVLENEARELNKFFLTYIEKHRPYITLKWATSADGFIDDFNPSPKALTSKETNIWAHTIRSYYDAILVGFNTALKDNPSLTVRHVNRPSPKRFVIDLNLDLPHELQLFSDVLPLYILNTKREEVEGKKIYKKLDASKPLHEEVARVMYELKIQSVLVEGGAATHKMFLDAGLWDEILEFETPVKIGDGIKKALEPKDSLKGQCVYSNELDQVFSYINK